MKTTTLSVIMLLSLLVECLLPRYESGEIEMDAMSKTPERIENLVELFQRNTGA